MSKQRKLVGKCPLKHTLETSIEIKIDWKQSCWPKKTSYAQLKRAVGKDEKLQNFKFYNLKLESFAEIGKNQVKMERTDKGNPKGKLP